MTTTDIALGVNVDHVATLRQARGGRRPDPVFAALLAEQAGADLITLHVREDRRHVNERDLELLQSMCATYVNLEMAVTPEMLDLATRARPACVCLVPEKRQELTTEGGLDVAADPARVRDACVQLHEAGIRVAPFIDPDPGQIEAAAGCGADAVELHTGQYAEAGSAERPAELARLVDAARRAARALEVHAGHGLDYHNVMPVAAIADIVELNIGHAIVGRAVITGLHEAVSTMKQLMRRARAT